MEKENVALVPLATPLLAGPGSITAVLVWKEDPAQQLSIIILIIAIFLSCFLTYLVFYFGQWIKRALGLGGIRVVTRIMGLLLTVIAVQFMVSGIQQV